MESAAVDPLLCDEDKMDTCPSSLDVSSASNSSLQSTSETANECFIIDLNKNGATVDKSSISDLPVPTSDTNCRPSSDGSFVNSVVVHLDKSTGDEDGHSVMDIDDSDDSNHLMDERAVRSSTESSDLASSQHETVSSDSSCTSISQSSQTLSDVCISDYVVSEKKKGVFEPIILDVRGACTDTIFDSANVDDCSSVNESSHPAKSLLSSNDTDTVVKPVDAAPKSASETLRGLLTQASLAIREMGTPPPDSGSLKTLPNLPKSTQSSGEDFFQTKLISSILTPATSNSGPAIGTTQKTTSNINSGPANVTTQKTTSNINSGPANGTTQKTTSNINSGPANGTTQKTTSNINSGPANVTTQKTTSNINSGPANVTTQKTTSNINSGPANGTTQKTTSNINGGPAIVTTQKTTSNNVNLSDYCVVLQNDAKTNQLAAILVPKDNRQKVLASSKNSMANSTEMLQSPSGVEPVISQETQLVSATKPPLTPAERVANFVDRTIQNMTIKGKDLKSFDLFKMPTLKPTHNDPGFSCNACGESFKELCGLDGHLVRTVFNLIFDCSVCHKDFVFTNKCQMSLHAKLHPTFSIYNSIVSFMPYDADNINPPLLPESISLNISPQVNQVDSTSILSQSDGYTQSIQKIICGASDTDSSKNTIFKCSVCSICILPSTREKIGPKKFLTPLCGNCNMYLPSICALEAHKKIHRSSPDITCPECGETNLTEGIPFGQNRKTLFDHLDRCQHFNRAANLRCRCGVYHTDYQQLAQHFLDQHTVQLYRCQLCALAFTARKQLIAHHSTIHRDKTQTAKVLSTVLCNFCHVILKKGSELKEHVIEHLKYTQKSAKLMWKCFLCQKIFDKKEYLQLHTSNEHPHRPKRCPNCYTLFANRKNLVDHIMEKKCSWPPLNFQQCADLEPRFTRVNYNDYFAAEIIIVPKTVEESSSPTPQSSTKFIRIAPKEKINVMASVEHAYASADENQTQSTGTQSGTVSLSSQNDIGNERLDESTSKQKQSAQANQQNTKSIAKNVNCPVIVNKKLTFHNTPGVGEPNKSVALKIKPNTKISELNSDVVTLLNLSQSSNNADFSLFQCHKCKIVLIGQSRRDSHMHKHIEKGEMTGKQDETECVVCKTQVKNSSLTQHLKVHQTEGVMVCCRCQRTDFDNMEAAVSHGNSFCGYAIMTGMEVNIRPSAPKSGAGAPAAKRTIQSYGEKEKPSVNEKGAATVFPCLRCGLAFQSLSARDEHVSRVHDGTKITYHCLKCKKKDIIKTFSTKESVHRHLVKKHRTVNVSSVEKFIKAEERNARSGQTLPAVNSLSSDSSPSLPPKRLRIADNGDYMCGRCGFSCTASSEFSEHIQTHNTNKEPQCPECGLCFIIVPALKKHLFAVHKIKNVEEFLGKKDINLPVFEEEDDPMEAEIFPFPPTPKIESVSPVAEKRAVNPLECNVCYKVFNSDIYLRTHMRNHGMAFIRSKRPKT